jgi:hypothetical protein
VARLGGPRWSRAYPHGTEVTRWRGYGFLVGMLGFALFIPLAVLAYAVLAVLSDGEPSGGRVMLGVILAFGAMAVAWSASAWLVSRHPDDVFGVRRQRPGGHGYP